MAIDPVSLLGAAGSFLGLFKKSPSAFKQTRQGVLGQAAGAREAAELYGFNPLTLLGVSSPLGAGSGPGMGNAIGEAMALLADGFSRRSDVGEKEALERENTTLKERLTRATLQPEVPGVYDRIEQGPMIGASYGGRADNRSGGAAAVPVGSGAGDVVGSGVRPLPAVEPGDPRREVDHEAVRTHPGVIMIDSPWFPFRVPIPTLDGDEAVGLGELPLAATMLGGAALAHYGSRSRDWVSRFAPRIGGVAPSGYYPPREPRPSRYRPPRGLRPEHIYGF